MLLLQSWRTGMNAREAARADREEEVTEILIGRGGQPICFGMLEAFSKAELPIRKHK
jgi:hypothetical protein